ncbi:MAG: arylsulfatase A [Kiritimatiellia bacterium]|jgi:arylsulfatase A
MIKTKLLSFLALFGGLLASTFAADRPNVVIIYGDDVGYNDVSAYGSKLIQTPNIDRLAKDGLRFTDGHCSAATCTPSRFSLLTGVHGFRHGVRILAPNAPLSIPVDALTLPDVFKNAGYTTAVIGKWHLGIGKKGTPVDWNGDVKPGPLEVGFDYSFLLPSTNDRVPCVYLEDHRVINLDPKDPLFVGNLQNVDPRSTRYPDGKKNPEAMTYYKSTHGHNNSVINGVGRIGSMAGGKSALWNDETMTDEYVKQMKKYVARVKDQPFFLFFSSQAIHVPRMPNPRFHGSTDLGYRGDSMVEFDWATGEILNTLDAYGLTENTIVIFSSDNGPVYDDGYSDGTVVQTSSKEVDQGHDGSGPFRGGKYQIYEGGTRVPFIIRWPAKIKPGVSDALVNQIDFVASFSRLISQALPKNEAVDSRDTLDAFLGKDAKGLSYMIEEAGTLALRKGDWKYIRGGKGKRAPAKGELYNLKDDQGEQSNVIAQHPEMAKELETMLKKLVDGGRVRR